MRQPDLCDGCLQPLPESFVPSIGVDVYEETDEDDTDDGDPVNDEDYTKRFHDWGCVWVFAGRQCEEIPSIPMDAADG